MCMITRCWSFWCLHFSFPEKHQAKKKKKGEKHGSYMSTTLLHLFTRQQQEDRPGSRSWRANNWWTVWPPLIPGRFVESAEEIIALVWNGHSAFIWVNGAEGEIFCRSLALCQHVEKRRLPENENSCEEEPSGPRRCRPQAPRLLQQHRCLQQTHKTTSLPRIRPEYMDANVKKHFAQLQGQIIP